MASPPQREWSDTSLVAGPLVAGRETEFAALGAWRKEHVVTGNVLLQVVTRGCRVVECRVLKSSGDEEFDRRAVALYQGATDPSGGDDVASTFRVTVYGEDKSTPDMDDWR